jgi:hypothetical protein
MNTFVMCIALSCLILFRLAEARLGENGRDESTGTDPKEASLGRERVMEPEHHLITKPHDHLVRVMVGFNNNEGWEQVRGSDATFLQNMSNLRISTLLVTKENLKSLRNNPNIL